MLADRIFLVDYNYSIVYLYGLLSFDSKIKYKEYKEPKHDAIIVHLTRH